MSSGEFWSIGGFATERITISANDEQPIISIRRQSREVLITLDETWNFTFFPLRFRIQNRTAKTTIPTITLITPSPKKGMPSNPIESVADMAIALRFLLRWLSNIAQMMHATRMTRYIIVPVLKPNPRPLTNKSSNQPPTFTIPGTTPQSTAPTMAKETTRARIEPLALRSGLCL